MKSFFFILLLCAAFCLRSAIGASVCIRPGATGTGTGADWVNALTAVPTVFTRGNVYYLADGTYSGDRSLNTAASGSAVITIQYATPADHGPSTGWSDAYSVTNAFIDGGYTFSTPYWVFNGTKGGETNGFGIVMTRSASRTTVASTAPGLCTVLADNVTIMNVDGYGYPPGTAYTSMGTPGVTPTGFFHLFPLGNSGTSASDVVVSNCFLHDCFGGMIWILPNDARITIDRNYFLRNRDDTANNHDAPIMIRPGSHDIVVSRNIARNTEGSAHLVDCISVGGASAGIISNVWVWGNIGFQDGDWDHENSLYFFAGNSDSSNPLYYQQVHVYNNTLYRLKSRVAFVIDSQYADSTGINLHDGFYANNNLLADEFYNPDSTTDANSSYIAMGFTIVTNRSYDYNFYHAIFARGGAGTNMNFVTGPHENGFLSRPAGTFYSSNTNAFGGFVNAAAYDLRLVNTNAGYPALDFGTNFVDRNGLSLRGVVGANGIATAGAGDATPPTIAIQLPTISPAWSTNVLATAISGIAADDTALSSVTWINDRGGSGTATGTTTWSISSATLQLGVNVITVTAHDSSGNVASDVITITVSDTISPSVAITNPNGGNAWSTNAPTITITGTSSDDIGPVTLYWTNSLGGGGVPTGTANWTISAASLTPGTNVISVRASDSAGNTNYATQTIVYTPNDTTHPVVTITSPSATGFYSTSSQIVDIYGTSSDNVSVLNVQFIAALSDGSQTNGYAVGTVSWSVPGIHLLVGINTIQIAATDPSGNVGFSFIQITYTPADTNLPVVNITSPTTSPTYATTNASIILSGTASDDVSVSNVNWTSSAGYAGAATGTTNWTAGPITLQPGANVITVAARDPSANRGVDTIVVTYTAPDTTKPVVTISSPTTSPAYATSSAIITIGGSASDANGISTVTWSNHRGGSGTALGGTSWNALNIPLQSGANVITITATDPSGNQGEDAITITYTPPVPADGFYYLFRKIN